MRKRITILAPVAAVLGFLGICGLPLLLSIGLVGAIAGWSLQSWVLIGLGIGVAALGGARWARSRRDGANCPASDRSVEVDNTGTGRGTGP